MMPPHIWLATKVSGISGANSMEVFHGSEMEGDPLVAGFKNDSPIDTVTFSSVSKVPSIFSCDLLGR
jgi:hypothetical protein